MSAGERGAGLEWLAGVWPGEQGLAARIGDRLTPLPGRWRWRIERLLGWWFAELSALFRLPRKEGDVASIATIADADLLRFTFPTPPETLGLVRERIALLLEERTPFAIGDAMAAYRLVSDGPDVRVHVWLTPIERLKRAWPAEGAEQLRLDGAGAPPMFVTVPDGLLDAARRRKRTLARRRRHVISAALIFAFVAVSVVPILARQDAVARAQAAFEQDRLVMAPLIRRATQARAAERATAQARTLQAAAPSPLILLDRLTRLIGDDGYLTEFRIAGRNGVIGGHTIQASALPEMLEADAMLFDVQLAGAVSSDERDGRQRFEIAFKAKR